MRKEDKGLIIAQLGEMLKQYPHFYIVDVEGMNAGQTSTLRRMCFKNNLKMVVVKNTLLQKALDASEIDFEALNPVLVGTTAVLFTEVANAPAKMLKELKSKNDVISDIVALLQSPAKNVLSALQSGQNTIHGVLKTLGERPE